MNRWLGNKHEIFNSFHLSYRYRGSLLYRSNSIVENWYVISHGETITLSDDGAYIGSIWKVLDICIHLWAFPFVLVFPMYLYLYFLCIRLIVCITSLFIYYVFSGCGPMFGTLSFLYGFLLIIVSNTDPCLIEWDWQSGNQLE